MTDAAVLITALQRGDQAAFAQLVDQYTPELLQVAQGYSPNSAIAEELVQQTWTAFVKGGANVDGRSSLRTWLFAVMTEVAKGRDIRGHRDEEALVSSTGPTVDRRRFYGFDDPRAGAWMEPPVKFPDSPEGSVLELELRAVAKRGLDTLPWQHRQVVMLRDMIGLDSAEVCEVLAIGPAAQRVLLHRGRAAIRQILENHLRIAEESPATARGDGHGRRPWRRPLADG